MLLNTLTDYLLQLFSDDKPNLISPPEQIGQNQAGLWLDKFIIGAPQTVEAIGV